jgi:hypothetical protein
MENFFVLFRNNFLAKCANEDNCMSVIATDRMSQATAPAPKPPITGGTRIQFDLEKVLTPE